MSGIHDAILEYTRDALEVALITDIAEGDPARAGVVQIGPIQDDLPRMQLVYPSPCTRTTQID